MAMFADLLAEAIGPERAQDLQQVLDLDPQLGGGAGQTVPTPLICLALHFLLFEDLMKRSPCALAVAGEALQTGETLVIDHAAVATLDAPYTGDLRRGRHHLGQILEPLGYIQMEAHSLPALAATAHIYSHGEMPGVVPDFVVMEVHGLRHEEAYQIAARQIFGQAPTPGHIRVQTALRKLSGGQTLILTEAAEFLQGVFAWFGRQHVPPTKADHATLAEISPISAWMAHEGQGISHMTLRVDHLSATMDRQMRQGRSLQGVRTSLDQTTRLVGLVPDTAPRPFRDLTNRIVEVSVPIANLAFMERGQTLDGARFEAGLF